MRLERRYSVRHATLPLAVIITRLQMRRTFDEEKIENLAENISKHGLIYPLCVADTEAGYVLISGDRRLRACRLMESRGHLIEALPVIIFENLTPIEMALLQASENIHEQVPTHEAAQFYESTWRAIKIHEPGFTLVDFAKAVGRGEQTIRNALRFVLLPELVRQFVAQGTLAYGSAIHIARLKEYLDDESVEQWALRAITSRTKVSEVHEQVDRFISDIKRGQFSMRVVFEEAVHKAMEQESRRMLIDRATIMFFWNAMAYLQRLLYLFEQGKVDPADSPWLRRSPRRAYRELIALERRVLDHIKVVLSEEEVESIANVLKECEELISV